MKIVFKLLLISIAFVSFSAQAGTINAGFYFSQDCLAKLHYKPLPSTLTFVCTQEGKCFANDMQMNSLLLCAQPFGSTEIKTISTKTYHLSSKGLK